MMIFILWGYWKITNFFFQKIDNGIFIILTQHGLFSHWIEYKNNLINNSTFFGVQARGCEVLWIYKL